VKRVFALLWFAGAACGPVQSSTLIVDAAAELAAADTAQANELAPFEYTAAEAYLHKAREEQSYADFELAVDFARKSRACARVARMIAEAKTKEKMGATRPTIRTRAKCRPGPEREGMPDAQDEAMVEKRAPAAAAPAKAKAKPKAKPAPKKPIKPKEPAPKEPEDPPLPEGDEMPEGDS
jgi:hypothetical protein